MTANRHARCSARRRRRGSTRRSRGRSMRCCRASARTGIGSSSSRPMRRSRPNTSCCSIISARSTPSSKQRIARYLRATQGEHGGWPLFHGGDFDLSASVKAYFALKAVGDPADAPHMARARAAILARGGARALQRLHPHPARAVRRGAVARGAGDAGRDHAAAALVSVSSRQDVVLVAHRASCRCWC